jgi:hypothetical protein
VSLPGADELFRATGATTTEDAPTLVTAEPLRSGRPGNAVRSAPRPSRTGNRRPSGRERHDEKITVYVSPDELLDLEQARLALRAEHGLVADRGRIVREALAVVLADLDAKGADSILVRRLLDR